MTRFLLLSLLLLGLCACDNPELNALTVERVVKDGTRCYCVVKCESSEPKWFNMPCADSVKAGSEVQLEFIYE